MTKIYTISIDYIKERCCYSSTLYYGGEIVFDEYGYPIVFYFDDIDGIKELTESLGKLNEDNHAQHYFEIKEKMHNNWNNKAG